MCCGLVIGSCAWCLLTITSGAKPRYPVFIPHDKLQAVNRLRVRGLCANAGKHHPSLSVAANVLSERMALFSGRFKGFNSLQPETQYIISNPPDSYNCGKPLISPSSSLSPHVIFSNTSCSSSSKSSLIFFMPSPAWNRTCLSVDEGILL